MIGIHFSEPTGERAVVPLAAACGIKTEQCAKLLFAGSYKPLLAAGRALWKTAPIGEASLACYLYDYDTTPGSAAFAQRARDAGLPCLYFDTTDSSAPSKPEYGLVYRSSIIRSRMTVAERAMPPLCEDLQPLVPARPTASRKPARPSVSFCGYVSPAWKQAVRILRGERDKIVGHVVRRRALRALERDRKVDARFIARPQYSGGGLTSTPEMLAQARREFVENLAGSDYALCARGAGNFSLRFYEALSLGRIPLLIDTACVLPFEDRIDWRRHCVIIPEDRIDRAGEILVAFHESLTDEAFAELQRANRELWDRWVSPVAFHQRCVAEATDRA